MEAISQTIYSNAFLWMKTIQRTLGYRIRAVGKCEWIKGGARKNVKIALREVVSNKRVFRKEFWYLLQNYNILLIFVENSNKSGGI